MDFNLENKVALITGSSRGIGLQIAQKLFSENCKVVLNSRKLSELKVVSENLNNSFFVVGDVTKNNEAKNIIEKVIKRFAKLDILVCNVGNGISVPPGEETPEEWRKQLSQNFFSATNIIEYAIPFLKKNKRKHFMCLFYLWC